MTLLISIIAAVISTFVWYRGMPENKYRTGILCWMFWGASIMWFTDAIYEYSELGALYFSPALEDMINDIFLGLSVVALGLVIWIVRLLILDPKGVIKGILSKKDEERGTVTTGENEEV